RTGHDELVAGAAKADGEPLPRRLDDRDHVWSDPRAGELQRLRLVGLGEHPDREPGDRELDPACDEVEALKLGLAFELFGGGLSRFDEMRAVRLLRPGLEELERRALAR